MTSPVTSPRSTADTIDLAEIVRTLIRNSRTVLLFLAIGVFGALAVVVFAPRRFSSASTIMVRMGGSSGASIGSRIPGIADLAGFGALGGASTMETELQILRSRALAGQVVDSLKLQFRVISPRTAPFQLIRQGEFLGSFAARKVRFERSDGGRYRALAGDSAWNITPGVSGRLDIGSVTLAESGLPGRFEIIVLDREAAIDRFLRHLQAIKAGGDIARVTYEADDSLTAAAVPNLLTQLYLQTHKTLDRGVNQRRVEFVLSQIDSVGRALSEAERSLRQYQESSRIIDAEIVGQAEVTGAEAQRQRLTDLQVEEGTMRQLLAQAQEGHLTSLDLAAYPGFLKSTTAASLAKQLTDLEAERIRLLSRRTERDPDVIAVEKTMRVVEGNIAAMARSYLGSVSKQRAEVEARLDTLQKAILAIPAAAERGGRLKRDVMRLSQIYAALQAQLIEARFGAVSEGGLSRQVDAAVPPREPSFPKPFVTMGVGTAGGLLCGLVAALFMGWFGRWLRDPYEVERAVGIAALRYVPNTPLLIRGTDAARTVLLIPLGAGAPTAAVAERLATTARQRALEPVIVDFSGPHSEQVTTTNGRAGSVIAKLEAEHDAVIVRLPGLGSDAAAAALSETRPVLFVAPPGPIDRAQLNNAVHTLRLLNVPCAGVIMNDRSRELS